MNKSIYIITISVKPKRKLINTPKRKFLGKYPDHKVSNWKLFRAPAGFESIENSVTLSDALR